MEVTIERILPGGLGLAHSDGQTIMVALAAPGDRVRVKIERVKNNVAFASIVEIITASPDRVEPPCPYFGRCGGCDFQQLNYPAQLAAKVEIIKDCLHRIAHFAAVPDVPVVPAPKQWHYRARAQWQYDREGKRLGYFQSGSRRVCDVAECAVLVPELQRTIEGLRTLMARHALPEGVPHFRAIAGDGSVAIAPPVPLPPENATDFDAGPNVADGSSLAAQRAVTRTIAGESYRLNAESFFQTNTELLPQLIDAALGSASGEVAVELYCGVGLFTLPLARKFKQVTAVEDDTSAARFARKNVASAGLTNARIEKSDVSQWLARACGLVGPGERPRSRSFASAIDFLLLDPPRTGAESRVINGILKLKPKQICYVSCDPATLARDLRKLLTDGYSLDSIVAFDMFPQTHHVETVVHLSG